MINDNFTGLPWYLKKAHFSDVNKPRFIIKGSDGQIIADGVYNEQDGNLMVASYKLLDALDRALPDLRTTLGRNHPVVQQAEGAVRAARAE